MSGEGERERDSLPRFEPDADVSIGGLDDDYPTGMILADRYRIVRGIGHGSMSAVYVAEHVTVGRQVAIKILKREVSRSPDIVERFRREARVATSIGHPNIVEVFDFGETKLGDKYVVMEYLGGRTLSQELARIKAFDLERALPIVMQICRALHAAHKVGIVHRDLKPANVMLVDGEGYRDFVKVLDFGLAKLTERGSKDRITRAGAILGTPEYMAPEQMTGTAIDRRADVYALGCMLYEMLVGDPPFLAADELSVLYKHAHEPVRRPSEAHPNLKLPRAFEDALLHSLAKDPDARYDSMAEFESALTAAATQAGIRTGARLGMTAMAAQPQTPQAPSAITPTFKLAVATGILAALVAGVAVGRFAPRRDVAGGGAALGVLVVESQPMGARASVDGHEVGVTPAVVHDLAAGRHDVELLGDGFVPAKRQVEVRAHDVATVRVALQHSQYKVKVASTPPGARLIVDSVTRGETPMEVELAEHEFHELRLEKPGFEPWQRYVKSDEHPAEIAGELAPTLGEFASLFVESDVVARVLVDGRDTGFTTPTAELRIAPGKHVITCREIDGETVRRVSIAVKAGDIARKFVQMK